MQHSFTPEAYTTSLDLTSQLPEGDELQSDAAKQYTGVVAWYRDKKTGEQKKITEGDQTNPKHLKQLVCQQDQCRAGGEAGG